MHTTARGRRLARIGSIAGTAGLIALRATISNPAAADPADSGIPTVSVNSCGNNFSAIHVTLPSGFNALTATPAQLETVDLPPRPTDPTQLAIWQHFVTSPISDVSSCSNLRSTPLPGPGGPDQTSASSDSASPSSADLSANWDGNVADDEPYKQVEADWILQDASGNSSSMSSQWVGLGLGTSSSSPLYQAGTEADGNNTYAMWIEVFPQEAEQFRGGADYPGDLVHVHVTMTSTGASFYLDNETEGWSGTWTWTGTVDNPNTAEWIDERPTTSAGKLPLYADQDTTFYTAKAYANGGWIELGSSSHYDYDMENCAGTILMSNNSGLSYNDEFTSFWKSYGTVDNAGCKS